MFVRCVARCGWVHATFSACTTRGKKGTRGGAATTTATNLNTTRTTGTKLDLCCRVLCVSCLSCFVVGDAVCVNGGLIASVMRSPRRGEERREKRRGGKWRRLMAVAIHTFVCRPHNLAGRRSYLDVFVCAVVAVAVCVCGVLSSSDLFVCCQSVGTRRWFGAELASTHKQWGRWVCVCESRPVGGVWRTDGSATATAVDGSASASPYFGPIKLDRLKRFRSIPATTSPNETITQTYQKKGIHEHKMFLDYPTLVVVVARVHVCLNHRLVSRSAHH